jgi:hypothetical protein
LKKKIVFIIVFVVVLITLIVGYVNSGGLTNVLQSGTNITLKEIINLLDLRKKELETRLNGQYRVLKNNEESYFKYECKNLGITVVVSYGDDVMWVECNSKITINGAKLG